MIKLKDILNEVIQIYSVDVVIVSDKDANFTDILDGMRATRKVTIINANTSDEVEAKNRARNDGKEVHTATMKFAVGKDPKQDLEFLKTTMLSSDKGDPEQRIPGLRHLMFKPETLTRL
jgi:Pyruvate/2-oxoacid:ferredoxin oxidoreductase gamma subunit